MNFLLPQHTRSGLAPSVWPLGLRFLSYKTDKTPTPYVFVSTDELRRLVLRESSSSSLDSAGNQEPSSKPPASQSLSTSLQQPRLKHPPYPPGRWLYRPAWVCMIQHLATQGKQGRVGESLPTYTRPRSHRPHSQGHPQDDHSDVPPGCDAGSSAAAFSPLQTHPEAPRAWHEEYGGSRVPFGSK